MGMVVRTNTMALNAYRQLGMNNNAVAKSLEKLSSGFRINRAGDDAAGLAISEKMKAQIKGLETASSNAQDGISLIQTAEGNLSEVHDMLNRMVELSTKSANGIYTPTERQALQDEVNALLDEIDRISKSANFNGIKLLDGSLGNVKADSLFSTAAGSGTAATQVDEFNIAGALSNVVDGHAPTNGGEKAKDAFYVGKGDVSLSAGYTTADSVITITYKDGVNSTSTSTVTITLGKDTSLASAADTAAASLADAAAATTATGAGTTSDIAKFVTTLGSFAGDITTYTTGGGTSAVAAIADYNTAKAAFDTALGSYNTALGNVGDGTDLDKVDALNDAAKALEEAMENVYNKATTAIASGVTATNATGLGNNTELTNAKAITTDLHNKAEAVKTAVDNRAAGTTAGINAAGIAAAVSGGDATITSNANGINASATKTVTVSGADDFLQNYTIRVDHNNELVIEAKEAGDKWGVTGISYTGFSDEDKEPLLQVNQDYNGSGADGTGVAIGLGTKVEGHSVAGVDGDAKIYVLSSAKLDLTNIQHGQNITMKNPTNSTASTTYVFIKSGEELAEGAKISGAKEIVYTDAADAAKKLAKYIDDDSNSVTAFASGNTIRLEEDHNQVKDQMDNVASGSSAQQILDKSFNFNELFSSVEKPLTAASSSTKLTVGGEIPDGTVLKLNGKSFEFLNDVTTDVENGKKGDNFVVKIGKDATENAKALAEAYNKATNGTSATANGNEITIEGLAEGDAKLSATIRGLVLQIGDTAQSFNKMNVSINDMSSKGLKLTESDGSRLSIMDADRASAAIDKIKDAINTVSSTRAGMGALQNRLEHTINNLDVAVENLNSANSRIRDTDMAKEMMNYTKMNVLVQSAQAMLAQANQQPQSVLQLLQ